MGFFDSLTANAKGAGSALRFGSSIGGGAAELLGSISARKAADEEAKTIDAFAAVNARRIGRQMRARLGSSNAEAAALGGGQSGSNLFIAADNARNAEENRQSAFLEASLKKTNTERNLPSVGGAALGFTTTVLGASARRANDQFEGSNG